MHETRLSTTDTGLWQQVYERLRWPITFFSPIIWYCLSIIVSVSWVLCRKWLKHEISYCLSSYWRILCALGACVGLPRVDWQNTRRHDWWSLQRCVQAHILSIIRIITRYGRMRSMIHTELDVRTLIHVIVSIHVTMKGNAVFGVSEKGRLGKISELTEISFVPYVSRKNSGIGKGRLVLLFIHKNLRKFWPSSSFVEPSFSSITYRSVVLLQQL